MNHYEMFVMGGSTFLLDQEDFDKLQAHSNATLVKLKTVIINPRSITFIKPIEVKQKKEIEGYFDEDRKVFVQTGEKMVDTVTDRFKGDEPSQLS